MQIELTIPDELAAALERTGLPAATLCERALEQAVGRATALQGLDPAALDDEAALPHCTARARTAVRLAFERGGPAATTADLLHGLLTEGKNLAVRLLPALGVDPARIAVDGADGGSAAAALELAHLEATGLGHNYVGGEHLLLGLLAEPDGLAGRTLRAQGVDLPGARAAVVAALTGYTHGRVAGR
ncbi:Clp protease N-terminal domain-containing protein [Dactylosporangium sp. NPDC051541]|uniref:Clp protease N-terminal domain-containing protein n=1 Tax=Dactylosporangium sp. NPDC051541 TaxID=3363977 RepID=UPI00378C1BD4